MLLEEQVSELLKRCEKITGQYLKQLRGNLKQIETRAAAIFELIVIETVSKVGIVEYEPLESEPSPDIRLTLPNKEKIWIEIKYIISRFWKEEKQSKDTINWIAKEIKRKKINLSMINFEITGKDSEYGMKVSFPKEQERKSFLRDKELNKFFQIIEDNPNLKYEFKHSNYSFKIIYNPNIINKNKTFFITSKLLENPKVITEDSLYRTLKEKANQHNLSRRVLCIGSDQSNATRSLKLNGELKTENIINQVFSNNSSILGVLLVNIESKTTNLEIPFIQRGASHKYYDNSYSEDEIRSIVTPLLSTLNFNKWKFLSETKNSKQRGIEKHKKIMGNLVFKPMGNRGILKVPVNLMKDMMLTDINIIDFYNIKENSIINSYLKNYKIKNISFEAGDIETAEDNKIVFELESKVFDSIFSR